MMKPFFKQRVVEPFLKLLKQGATPSGLALAVSLGIVIGFVPLFGSCTLLCLAAIWIFKVNPAAVFIANQVAYPLQFVFYFPFIRMGEFIFQQPRLPLSITEIFDLFASDFVNAISVIGWSTLFALLVWLMVSIPVTYFLFYMLRILFSRVKVNG
jgi:uncharacterized protein (DUF2062 family)